jgi:hypothetical protein
MPERSSAVVTWSAAVCAGAAALAGFAQHVRWVFTAAIVIAVAALATLLVAGIPDFLGWLHERVGRESTVELEIIVKRQFAVDYENSSIRLVRVNFILQNNSAGAINVTKIILKPFGFPGPAKLVGGNLPEIIEPGGAESHTIRMIDITDILGLTSPSDQPNEPTFSIHVESGYGSALRTWTSEPFSLRSKYSQPFDGGFSEWTE